MILSQQLEVPGITRVILPEGSRVLTAALSGNTLVVYYERPLNYDSTTWKNESHGFIVVRTGESQAEPPYQYLNSVDIGSGREYVVHVYHRAPTKE